MTRLKCISTALLAGASLAWAFPALAQDAAPSVSVPPAATDVGTINVEGAGQVLGSGYIVPEDGPKDRSTVTDAGVGNLLPTSNPFQMINILPGVNQVSEDALGLAGGTIRVRGLVGSQMGFTINGAPFNDSGNFNVYPSEIIDAENVRQIWVTQGSTDIDAPHVGASGGNIGVVTRQPRDNFSVQVEGGAGMLDEERGFIAVDTGWIGNVKAFASFSYTHADKWRGDGDYNRRHIDGNLVWQFLPESSAGLTWVLNDSINPYYRDYASSGIYNVYIGGKTAYQTFQTIGRDADYDTFWGTSSAYPIYRSGAYSTGSCATHPDPACTVTNPDFPQLGSGSLNTNASNSYVMNINPYRNGVITAPVHLQVTDNLRWETNGYLWFGEGGAVFGSTALDDNQEYYGYKVAPQYGDAPNSNNALLLAEGTINKTFRPGVTSKFVYDVDNYTITGGGWLEHAHMDYGTPFSIVGVNGVPCDKWMTSVENYACIVTGTSAYGTGPVYNYHYVANSIAEALFFEAQGRYLDDALKVTVGLSDRQIIRDVRNFDPICATDPSLTLNPGTNIPCASYANTTAFTNSATYRYFDGPTVGAAAAYAAMRKFGAHPHVRYDALLPEAAISYDIDSNQQVFASISTGLRTPSVGNLTQVTSSTSATGSNILKITDVKSEYAASWEAGYRWHDDFFVASATAYLQDLRNYQASVEVDPSDYITANIGNVKIYGIDFEAGTRPWHGFTFYASAEVQNSVLSDNMASSYSGNTVLYAATRGKQLVDTPNWLLSASVGYAQDGFFADITPHCRGQRATALLNDEFVPANCTVNLTAGYHFDSMFEGMRGATLQIYALNLFDSNYFGEIYTQGQTNAKLAQAVDVSGNPIAGKTLSAESYSAEPGAPFFFGAKLSFDLSP